MDALHFLGPVLNNFTQNVDKVFNVSVYRVPIGTLLTKVGLSFRSLFPNKSLPILFEPDLHFVNILPSIWPVWLEYLFPFAAKINASFRCLISRFICITFGSIIFRLVFTIYAFASWNFYSLSFSDCIVFSTRRWFASCHGRLLLYFRQLAYLVDAANEHLSIIEMEIGRTLSVEARLQKS